ncbi:MAG: XRE family transcriptional regulator [Bacteroides sp.]|nr:XRE family transcriptional regulator [Eubacterium sp.]MCM1463755.1 XRE family transcriptional regulator [Bacteroides sp.]
MSIGSRIKERRLELGLTQPHLAELLGVSKGAVGNYECDLSAPNEKILIKLFDILKCDPNFLYQDSISSLRQPVVSDSEIKQIKKYRVLDEHGKDMVDTVLEKEYTRCAKAPKAEISKPAITIKHSTYKVSAGLGFDLEDRDSWEEIEISDTPEAQKADFAVTIKGNSMEPLYYDGDIVLVRTQSTVDVGETGVYIINGGGFIKRYGGDRLISLNPEYDDIFFSEDDYISCAGKVIGVVS